MPLLTGKPTLRLTITAALVSMTLGTAGAITWLTYRSSRATLLETTQALLGQVAERIAEKTKSYLAPVKNAALTTAEMAAAGVAAPDRFDQIEAVYFALLRAYPKIASLDFGDRDGNFLMVKRMPDGSLATKTLRRAADGVRSGWKLRDPQAGLAAVRETVPEPGDTYDPRLRPWYTAAIAAAGLQWTDVYLFATDRQPAITAAVRLEDAAGVPVAVTSASITLGEIGQYLDSIRIPGKGKLLLVDRQARLIAYPGFEGVLAPLREQAGLPAELAGMARTASFAGILASASGSGSGSGSDIFRYTAAGRPYLGVIEPLSYAVGNGWFVGAILAEDDLLGEIKRNIARTLLLVAGIAAVALIGAAAIGRWIARPLRDIAAETRRLRRLEFADRPLPESHFEEVSEMLQAFANLKVGLRAFEKYVPTDLVRLLLESNQDPRLGGRLEELTLFFSDIRGFSGEAEKLGPQELADWLGEYFELMSATVRAHGGAVDKFIGDAVMAFWNAPLPVDDHPYRAVLAALACLDGVRRLDPADRLHTRIGIHTAPVMVGNFGSRDRFGYTAMGDGVNLASRLEGVNKEYGTQILLTEEVFGRLEGRIECRRIDRITVKGKDRPTGIFEPFGPKGEVDPERLARARRYEQALAEYFARRFAEAAGILADLRREDPADLAARTLHERSERYRVAPPPEGWNGVFAMQTK